MSNRSTIATTTHIGYTTVGKFTLLLLLACILSVMHLFLTPVTAIYVSESFQKVIDKATSDLILTTEWNEYLQRKFTMVNPVPTCSTTSSLSYPSSFNYTKENLVMCYDKGALEPWPLVYTKFGQMLVSTIAKQYPSMKLTANFTEVDIVQLGYFPSLKGAVDSGACDVAIASTHYSDSRAASAHFQCSYGMSYSGLLRTELDNTTYVVTSENDLNQAGLIIAVANTSTFDAFVTQSAKKATIIRLDEYQDAWPLVLGKKIHVLLGDGSDLLFWLSKNRDNCYSCNVKLYGTPFSYGSFITSNILKSSAVSTIQHAILLTLSFLSTLFLLFVL